MNKSINKIKISLLLHQLLEEKKQLMRRIEDVRLQLSVENKTLMTKKQLDNCKKMLASRKTKTTKKSESSSASSKK